MIGRKRAAVDVVEVLVDGEDGLEEETEDQRLRRAIAAARLPLRKPGARPDA